MSKTERLGLRVSPEDKEAWAATAAAEGISLSAWLSKWANHGLNEAKQENNLPSS